MSFSCMVSGQDPHFSQFFASPLTLNPAYAGNFDGLVRVAGNYRNQWPAFGNAFITSTISVEGKLFTNKVPDNDQVSLGLLLLSDQTGGGLLRQNHVGGTVAYTKSLDYYGMHLFTAGFQVVWGNYRFDPSYANFEDELGPSGFTLPSAESLLSGSPSRSFMDVNTGFLYRGSISDDALFYLGASAYHINKPELGYVYAKQTISPRYNIHGGGFMGLGVRTTLHASMQYQRQDHFDEWVAGSAISQLVMDKPRSFLELYAGMWMRNGDALIPYVGMEWNAVRAGISYDVLLPSQRLSSVSYQSIELSLIWTLTGADKRNELRCPKF